MSSLVELAGSGKWEQCHAMLDKGNVKRADLHRGDGVSFVNTGCRLHPANLACMVFPCNLKKKNEKN
jgi:hypothetical protein